MLSIMQFKFVEHLDQSDIDIIDNKIYHKIFRIQNMYLRTLRSTNIIFLHGKYNFSTFSIWCL